MSPHSSPLAPPRLTLAPGRGVSGATEVQYCTSQPVLLSLPAHLQLGQTFHLAGVIRNVSLNPDLQALTVRCAVLSSLRPQGPTGVFVTLVAISAQDIGVDMGTFSCNLCGLGHA
jgi:hypothetical protein